MTDERSSAMRASLCTLGFALLLGCSAPLVTRTDATSAAIQPEAASGIEARTGWATTRFAVAAANPLATEAGYRILRAGGSAVDAAIAVQMVLTLVEPQSSGIGGGAFLMHFDRGEVTAWDGRETAPAGVTESLFLDTEGQPLPFIEAAASGRSVGVPGVLRMLEAVHREHGRLPWPDLFAPAIELAESGFAVSNRLHTMLATDPALRDDAAAAAFYYDAAGEPWPVGHVLTNPALAAILRDIAINGADALHSGPIARDIVARVAAHPRGAGSLSEQDLADYRPLRRDPLCTDWRRYRVCGFPPPSSGHLAMMQIVGILDNLPPQTDVLAGDLPSVTWLHGFLEAARLAFADRALYVADPDFVAAPGSDWRTLLAPAYLRDRAGLIGEQSMGRAEAGNPAPETARFAPQHEQTAYGTSHISIVDAFGNGLAMTTTIESAFGSRILADGGTGLPGGYLLNNELTDFSFRPRDEAGMPIANRVEPGKRPRSSMSPTLVFDATSGELLASLGSPGGAAIIHYTARALWALFDWGLDAQRALDLPHVITLGGPVFMEQGRWPEATLEALRARGHEVSERELTSGLQAIQRTAEGWFGGADPRREGVVMGE
ncbi:gamma-glutamyltransferase family protein [Azoarcus taiwanensis]|uniref:Gamma-glutamyltransferase n=1 Tax=Azoarcus taiwanensis TaxID=666964 RepID=A0A972F5G3_9RHOO|nr:gamma-glutamyltransferase family protein [Azoarcus taiwanensis]NMG01579.1 gamma-glutamyltransferase [Azoarcus taiwanensis]